MYARRIERIVAVADAQEPCRKLESLATEPRHLLENRAGAKRTVLFTVTDNAADGDGEGSRRGDVRWVGTAQGAKSTVAESRLGQTETRRTAWP